MRKIKLLLATMLSIFAWTGVMAQTQHNADNYEAAKAAITNGGVYRIKTNVSGTDYYVTSSGTLTSNKNGACCFTITKTSGGYYGTGFRIDTGTERFTNSPLSNNVANLKPGNYSHSSGDRTDWERQILYKNSNGKYAIRSCNVADGTSSWNDAGRTHWTYYFNNEDVTPCYSYTADYIWDFEGPLTAVNVTYKLVESNGTEVSSTTILQEANSDLFSPLPATGINYNGYFREKFYYDYAIDGTVGNTDCTITITRTEKAGIVKALSELSNNKAYNIGCDRGAMIAYNGSMVSTALNDATANAQPYGKFALLNYEDNYYIFSIDENKFIKNDASLALDLTAAGFSTEDAMVMAAQENNEPYFLWHFNATDKYLNTNGNQPLGYVINYYSKPDQGNLYYMIAVEDFDPTAALAELDAYLHPAYFVTYVVKDEAGNTLFTSEPQPAKAGAKITTLLAEFQRPYYTYSEEDVTITEQNTTVEFTATWNGPFKISTDFANAQWQNMAMRGIWYVTSGVKDGDGAYKTQEANTMGLVEDAYQWAFIGNGYDGWKIINKAAGDGKSFGWTDETATNAGIPTIMPDNEGHHAWKVVANTNTNVPAGSFCLNVPGTTLYINQYGGKGGSVKFWNSTGNISDDGSAFTVFDVPTNFASFVVEEIAPYMDPTGYFTFTDAAKTTIGYDKSMKTECSFADYKSMKEILTADFLSNISNYVLPETGYYILKNKYYGTYMGIDPSDANMYGNYKTANLAKNVVKLTKTGDATYTISLMGKYSPATVAQSVSVIASTDAATYTVVIPTTGYAAFQADPESNMSCLHCRAAGDIVGWESPADASKWEVTDAESVELTIGSEGYATAYLPFPVEAADGVTAYTGEFESTWLKLNKVEGTIPANTAVVLKGTPETYNFNIAADVDDISGNVLKGTLEPIAATGKYVLAQPDAEPVGFYLANSGNIAATKAYLEIDSEVRGFIFKEDGATAINSLTPALSESGVIYNVAGQRINKLQKGINIVNGKKILK